MAAVVATQRSLVARDADADHVRSTRAAAVGEPDVTEVADTTGDARKAGLGPGRKTPRAPASPPPPSREASAKLFFEAITLQEREPRRATAMLEGIVRSDPFESAVERLTELLFKQGRFTDATARASECLDLNPRSTLCREYLVKSSYAVGGDAQAMPAIEECLKENAKSFFCVRQARDYYLAHEDQVRADLVLEGLQDPTDRDEAKRQMELYRFYDYASERERAHAALVRACELGSETACDLIAKEASTGE